MRSDPAVRGTCRLRRRRGTDHRGRLFGFPEPARARRRHGRLEQPRRRADGTVQLRRRPRHFCRAGGRAPRSTRPAGQPGDRDAEPSAGRRRSTRRAGSSSGSPPPIREPQSSLRLSACSCSTTDIRVTRCHTSCSSAEHAPADAVAAYYTARCRFEQNDFTGALAGYQRARHSIRTCAAPPTARRKPCSGLAAPPRPRSC